MLGFLTYRSVIYNYIYFISKVPLDWEWENKDVSLFPIKMTQPPAPDNVVRMLFCSCSRGCGVACGCRKSAFFAQMHVKLAMEVVALMQRLF